MRAGVIILKQNPFLEMGAVFRVGGICRPLAVIIACVFIFMPQIAVSANAPTYAFTTLPVIKGATAMRPTGINDAGKIAGSYSYNCTISINFYSCNTNSFTYAAHIYKVIVEPKSDKSKNGGTFIKGINNRSEVAGRYLTLPPCKCEIDTTSFYFDGASYVDVVPPGNNVQEADVTGIANSGNIVGFYTVVGSPGTQGFLFNRLQYKNINYPGALNTRPLAINKLNEIVGFYQLKNGAVGYFCYKNGLYSTIKLPGDPTAINDLGEIAGNYLGGGYIYRNGKVATINVPHAAGTTITGLNNHDAIVGTFDGKGFSGVLK